MSSRTFASFPRALAFLVFLSARLGRAEDGGTVAHSQDFAALVRETRNPDADHRRTSCRGVADLGSAALPNAEARLGELRGEKEDGWEGGFRRLREALGAGQPSEKVTDTVLGDEPTGVGETLCILQLLARVRTTAALGTLVQSSADHGSQFRPWITLVLGEIGDRAVPALLEARQLPNSETRRWAGRILEEQKRLLPGDAIQSKNPEVVADVLRAFGKLRDQDALPVVMAFINSDRVLVREAARDAIVSYGPGGLWKLRETYANLLGQPPPDAWRAPEISAELFSILDRYRLRDVYALFDEGLEKMKAGALEEAIQRFDRVLGREPLLDRRGETFPAYVRRGRELLDTDRDRARALFERALLVDPTNANATQAREGILFLDARASIDHGAPQPELLREALRLDPTNVSAKRELARLEVLTEPKEHRFLRFTLAGVCALLALVATGFWGRKRTRP